ncbi:glycosyltransferase family 2 protein [Aggregatilineales bacterium SYSU G02658]
MTDAPPTLGVLITYYNERDLLTACLESLLANTQLPDEILVYDDCSEFPAADYVPDHPLIRVVRGAQNGGMVYARKQCVQLAASDYLHFHDADDLFTPTWVERVRTALPYADYIVTHGYLQYEDGVRELFPHLHVDALQADLAAYAIRYGLNSIGPTFHRSLAAYALNQRGDDLGGTWDYYSNALMTQHVRRFCFLDEPLYMIRMRASSLSRGQDNQERPNTYLNRMKALRLLYDDLPEQRALIVEMVTAQAGRMYKRGLKAEAKEGFTFAHRVGRPTYEHLGQPWRALARTFGGLTAEQTFALYTQPTLVAVRRRLKSTLGLKS